MVNRVCAICGGAGLKFPPGLRQSAPGRIEWRSTSKASAVWQRRRLPERMDVMIKTFAVVGGDLRQHYLAEQLMAASFAVSCYAVPDLPDTHASLHEAVCDAKAVALPMPALASPDLIASPTVEIPLRALAQSLAPGAVVFGGRLGPARALLAQSSARVIDYLDSERLAIANAVPSAEGAIALAMRNTPCTISGSRVLVVGFGRIGKLLAQKLHALGALVTVCARKEADLATVEAFGLKADETGRYARGLYQYACVFNTVPAPVFSAEQLRALQPGCVFLDLASGAGALEAGVRPPDSIRYIHALALPGKCAPMSAARALRDEILRTLSAFNL